MSIVDYLPGFGDTSVVVAVAAVTFIPIQSDDYTITNILCVLRLPPSTG